MLRGWWRCSGCGRESQGLKPTGVGLGNVRAEARTYLRGESQGNVRAKARTYLGGESKGGLWSPDSLVR
jgi:hypothetical protein